MITTYYFRALLGDSTSTRGQDSHTPFFSKTIGKKISINLVYIFIVINASLYTKQSLKKSIFDLYIYTRRYLTSWDFIWGHGKSHLYFNYKAFINRKVVMNSSFNHLSVPINLLFSQWCSDDRVKPIISWLMSKTLSQKSISN